MATENINQKVNENRDQGATDKNGYNDVKDENVPKKNGKIMKMLNSVDTNEIAYPLHT